MVNTKKSSVSALDLLSTIRSKLELCECDIMVFDSAVKNPMLMREDVVSKLDDALEQIGHIRSLIDELEGIEDMKEQRT